MLLGEEARAAHFPDLGHGYLDTATQGAGPRGAADALGRAVELWARGEADFALWEAEGERARELVAGLLGRAPTDVALVSSQVPAASAIAHGMPEATVVVPEQEYRSNLLPWISSRPAGRVRLVPAPATTERLVAAVDGGTDLVAVSSVQSADGLRVDVPRLVEHAHARGALVYVDASQSLGADADLRACDADLVAAVGYKWLLGARGLGYLAVHPHLHDRFPPLLASPQSASDTSATHYGPDYRPWGDARRFDAPPAWFALVASVAGLEVLTTAGPSAVDAHCVGVAERFRAGVREMGHPTAHADRPSAVVGVRHPEPEAALRALTAEGVRAALRDGWLRFAFHLYTDDGDADRALRALGAATTHAGSHP